MAGGAEGDLLIGIFHVGLGLVIEADEFRDIGQVFLRDRFACIGMNGHDFSPVKSNLSSRGFD